MEIWIKPGLLVNGCGFLFYPLGHDVSRVVKNFWSLAKPHIAIARQWA